MKNNLNKIKVLIENSIYCYGKNGGEGYVNKSNCQCYNEGTKNCQAIIDKEKFNSYFNELINNIDELSYNERFIEISNVRSKVIEIANNELCDSQWYKDNVKNK